MKSLRFPLIWLAVSMVLGWICCAIPWGKPTGIHGTGFPIPMAIWDKPKGSDHFMDYINGFAVVENPLLIFLVGILIWGVYRGVRFLVLRWNAVGSHHSN